MYKLLLVLFCAALMVLEPQAAQASLAAEVAVPIAVAEAVATPRPNYKVYRGNSRHRAKKLGVFKRWSLRRKALRKRKRKAVSPIIKVDKPIRNK